MKNFIRKVMFLGVGLTLWFGSSVCMVPANPVVSSSPLRRAAGAVQRGAGRAWGAVQRPFRHQPQVSPMPVSSIPPALRQSAVPSYSQRPLPEAYAPSPPRSQPWGAAVGSPDVSPRGATVPGRFYADSPGVGEPVMGVPVAVEPFPSVRKPGRPTSYGAMSEGTLPSTLGSSATDVSAQSSQPGWYRRTLGRKDFAGKLGRAAILALRVQQLVRLSMGLLMMMVMAHRLRFV